MDTEEIIDNFIKRARDHLQKKVNVAVRKIIEGRGPGAEFWMGNKATYKEMDDWLDKLLDERGTEPGTTSSKVALIVQIIFSIALLAIGFAIGLLI